MNFIEESLRQNRFWLQIMKEHALFIRLGLPCDETLLIAEAQSLERLFDNLLEKALNTPPKFDAVRQLNSIVIDALDKIISFKSDVLGRLITCDLGGSNLPLLIDHIRREAIRFRTILIRLQNNIDILVAEEALQEEIFWLRIMSEHARFIAHLLDPSERRLVNRSFELAEELETLRLQARDLESMEVPRVFENWLLPAEIIGQPVPPDIGDGLPNAFVIPRLKRFNMEVIYVVKEIKNFKETALNFIQECTVLSIIPPLLADHVLREAQMALNDLFIIENKLDSCRKENQLN